MSQIKDIAYNFLRPFPLFFAVLIFLLSLIIVPMYSIELHSYMLGVEVVPGSFWGLYYVTVPILISLIPSFFFCKSTYAKSYYYLIGFCLTFPLAIAFSIWLWELIGVVFMALYFLLFLGLMILANEEDDDKYNFFYLVFYFLVFLAYCLYRLFKPHTPELDLLVLAGFAFVSLLPSITLLSETRYSLGFFISVPLMFLLFYVVWFYYLSDTFF